MDVTPYQKPEFIPAEGKNHLPLRDIIKLSFRVFRVRPMRTFLTVLGMGVGIGTVFFLVSLGYGLQYILLGKLASTEDSLVSLEAYYPTEAGLSITQDSIQKISALPGVAEVSPVSELSGEIDYGKTAGYLIVRATQSSYFRLSGTTPDIGTGFSEGEHALVISSAALRLINETSSEALLGQQFGVKVIYDTDQGTKTSAASQPLTVKGIIADDTQPFVIVPIGALADPPPSYQRAFVKAKDLTDVEPLRDTLIGMGYLISAKVDLVNQAKQILNVITIVLGVFGVAALVVSAIGMFNTLIIGFLERIFEVGIMKAIGATSQDIRNLFLVESLMMGLMGGVGGIALGFSGAFVFNFILNFLARQLGGKPVNLFVFPPMFILFVIILSAVVGVLAGLWPARKAAMLSPKEAFLRK